MGRTWNHNDVANKKNVNKMREEDYEYPSYRIKKGNKGKQKGKIRKMKNYNT